MSNEKLSNMEKIKANELRRNNLITIENEMRPESGHPLRVLEIHEDSVSLERLDKYPTSFGQLNKFLRGIPLSESWLERAGFAITRTGAVKKYGDEDFSFTLNCVNGVYTSSGYRYHPISFVHQLQNYWYEITGKELEFKG